MRNRFEAFTQTERELILCALQFGRDNIEGLSQLGTEQLKELAKEVQDEIRAVEGEWADKARNDGRWNYDDE